MRSKATEKQAYTRTGERVGEGSGIGGQANGDTVEGRRKWVTVREGRATKVSVQAWASVIQRSVAPGNAKGKALYLFRR